MSSDKKNKSNLGDLQKIHDEMFLENIIGPDWLLALELFECDKNSTMLGELLKKHIPPAWIAKEIGKMMAPSVGYRGAKLKIDLPKLSRKVAFDKLREKIDIQLRIKELEKDGRKVESVIAQIMKETGFSRATLFEIKNMDFEKEFHQIMGNEEESRKEG